MNHFVICFLGAVFFLWVGGLSWFVLTIPLHAENPSRKTDAIVVLTGGPDRVEAALELIHDRLAQKLLISGVNPHTTLTDILKTAPVLYKNLNASVIDLDYQSDSTYKNAQQTAKWVQEHHFKSVRLVTAHYHIRRSLLAFHQKLPEVEILAHPIIPGIFQKKSWFWNLDALSILGREYHKYIGALFCFGLKSLFLPFRETAS